MSNYASGEVPMVGDVVTVVDASECTGVCIGERYTVKEVDSIYGGVWLADKSFASGFMCYRFRLSERRQPVADKEPHGMYQSEHSELAALQIQIRRVVDQCEAVVGDKAQTIPFGMAVSEAIAKLREENERLRLAVVEAESGMKTIRGIVSKTFVSDAWRITYDSNGKVTTFVP